MLPIYCLSPSLARLIWRDRADVRTLFVLIWVGGEAGERVPVARVGRDAAKAYSHDRHARVQEALLPFRRLCGRRAYANVETVVVEGDDVAEALLRYGAESGVRSLVLGSVSFRWFQRVLSIPDVPTAVLKNTQNSCNVFVVCKRTIIVKVSGYPQASTFSYMVKISLVMSQIQILSTECSEDARKVEHALHQEETLKQVAADEKAKHLLAIQEVEQAKRSFTREAYSKHKAEMVGGTVSVDKEKVVDAILSTSKNCRRYSKHEIELATDNFSEARKIGEGGYGSVYRCTLDHIEVAVKTIQQDSTDKIDEFLREVEILSKLHHPNLVMLIGFCPEIGSLVYEYMANGSLEDQLLDNKRRQPLHWFLRFRIIFEVSCGLAFLHGRKPEPIVHRDLKPANILLDKNYVGKIGDAGFAKLISDLVPDWQTEYTDTIVAGTLYYMDPEYQTTGTVRPKSDLFALGVIILQILTGKHPNGLIVSTENAIKRGSLSHILDKSQTDWPLAETEMLAKLGLWCTALKCRDRPDLESEVLPKLEEILHRISSNISIRNPDSCVPRHFICPLTQEVMDDPYVAADGHTYEHHAIKAWVRKHRLQRQNSHSGTTEPQSKLHVDPCACLRAVTEQTDTDGDAMFCSSATMQQPAKRPTFSKWSRRGAEPQGLPEWAAGRRKKDWVRHIYRGRKRRQTDSNAAALIWDGYNITETVELQCAGGGVSRLD
ncbi:hypothetical protein ACQ4PT_019084 [Festuca glaucescens]